MTKMEPSKGAAALVLHVNSMARQVRLERVLKFPMNYFPTETADSIYREVARPLQFRLAAHTVDGHIAEFDLLQCRKESRMQVGAGFPDATVFGQRMQNAVLPRQEESPALASGQNGLAL